MFRVLLLFVVVLVVADLRAQEKEDAGSGYALSFDGVDDFVDLGNVYDDLELPMTISAWIFLDVRGLGTIFASQDNSLTYNGFHFYIVQSAIIIEYGDGLGSVGAEFRRGKSGPVENISGKWVHVAAVVRGPSDMDLYLNGVNTGGKYVGESQSVMESDFPAERAQIGYRSVGGIDYHFQGMIDEVRLWNTAQTEKEIRDQMCVKLTGTEPGLVGYWNFDETKGSIATDESPNNFDGNLIGAPRRVFSGAPIGDESLYLYRDDWQGVELSQQDSLDNVSVKNISGNPEGIHIYKVERLPGQTGNLNLITVSKPYFGVYCSTRESAVTFDLTYQHHAMPVCRVFARTDNTGQSWTESFSSVNNFSERCEVIKELPGFPLQIDLGPDEAPCTVMPRILQSLPDTTGFTFSWQDGSSFSKLTVTDFGTYWLSVSNGCSRARDTLDISKVPVDDLVIPNIFTPNNDALNQYFEIDQRITGGSLRVYDQWGMEVYSSRNYLNNWDGSGLPDGIYFYTLSGGKCITEKKGTLTILK